jgi:hypothetical protein
MTETNTKSQARTARKLADVKGQDGWNLVDGYFLYYDHGLMAFTPAIRADTGEMVVCLSEAVADEVKQLLEPERRPKIKIGSKPFLTDGRTGFFIDETLRDEAEEVNVLSHLDVDRLCCGHLEPFRLAPNVL